MYLSEYRFRRETCGLLYRKCYLLNRILKRSYEVPKEAVFESSNQTFYPQNNAIVLDYKDHPLILCP